MIIALAAPATCGKRKVVQKISYMLSRIVQARALPNSLPKVPQHLLFCLTGPAWTGGLRGRWRSNYAGLEGGAR